jgi:hypothetical protein
LKNKSLAVFAALATAGGLALVTAAPAHAAEACYVDETHTEITYDLERSDWVAGTPATLKAGWYTEADDAAPTVSDAGLTFTAPGGQAVGVRSASLFGLGALSREGEDSWYTDLFHFRAVLDADGEPFGAGNWRNDYTSLTFLTADTVWVSGLNVEMTLDAVKAAYTGTITSVGYHLDSNAPAGTSVLFTGVDLVTNSVPESYTDWYFVSEGQGVELPDGREDGEEFQDDGLYRYVVTGDVEVTEQVGVECPAVVVPPTTPAATVKPASSTTLADTGFDGGPMLITSSLGLLVAGGVLALVAARRRVAAQK